MGCRTAVAFVCLDLSGLCVPECVVLRVRLCVLLWTCESPCNVTLCTVWGLWWLCAPAWVAPMTLTSCPSAPAILSIRTPKERRSQSPGWRPGAGPQCCHTGEEWLSSLFLLGGGSLLTVPDMAWPWGTCLPVQCPGP